MQKDISILQLIDLCRAYDQENGRFPENEYEGESLLGYIFTRLSPEVQKSHSVQQELRDDLCRRYICSCGFATGWQLHNLHKYSLSINEAIGTHLRSVYGIEGY